jgi:uridine kinase
MDYHQIFDVIKDDIIRNLKSKNRLIIGIDGMSTSGKTVMANRLKDDMDAGVIHMDDFFLQDHQRSPQRMKEVAGNIDYERFDQQVVSAIKNNHTIGYQAYDCQTKKMTNKVIDKSFKILIIEGAYALRKEWLDLYDLSYLMLIDPQIQLNRLEKRNPDMIQSFINQWIPMENTYIDHMNLKNKVDRVFYIG